MPRKAGPIRYLEVDMGHATPCHIPVRADGVVRKTDPDGYVPGRYKKGVPRSLHARAWIAENGMPPAGAVFDHLCRVRACCNAAHVEPVTDTENLRRGDVAKIDMAKALEIRARVAAGETQASVARSMGLSPQHVCNIVHGNYWSDGPSPAWERVKARRATDKSPCKSGT